MGKVIGAKMILRTDYELNSVAERGGWHYYVMQLRVQSMMAAEPGMATHARK